MGIVGIVIAYRQSSNLTGDLKGISESTQQQISALEDVSESTRQQTGTLQDISERLSTQYLGEFPGFLPKITELVKEANEKLTIFCDFPAYAALSAQDAFRDYRQAIENIRGKRLEEGDFRFIYLETNERKGVLDRQFDDNDDEEKGGWNKWKKEPEHEKRLEDFFKEHPPEDVKEHLGKYPPRDEEIPEDISVENISARYISFKAFKECFDSYNSELLRQVFANNATTTETQHRMPIYFWICDNRKAVFTLKASSIRGEREFGFSTDDPNFISAFNGLFEGYKEGARQ